MTMHSAYIECDPRETSIIENRRAWLLVMNLGGGKEVRRIFRDTPLQFPLAAIEHLVEYHQRGAKIYALGVPTGDVQEVSALYATCVFNRGQARLGQNAPVTWKFCEVCDAAHRLYQEIGEKGWT